MGKNRLLLRLLCCIAVSVSVLQTLYWCWPRAVCFDVTFSLFAAQNAANHGRFETLEPNAGFDSDLGKIKLQWLTTWPPLLSLGYAALFKLGLNPAGATGVMVVASLMIGSCGWVLLCRQAGASLPALYTLALSIPWMSFPTSAMTSLLNDHVAWAISPWGFLLLLGLPGTDDLTQRALLWRVPTVAIVCGLVVAIKYSAFPLLIGASLFFLLRDGWIFNLKKAAHATWFAFCLALPGILIYSVNHAFTGETSAVLKPGFKFFIIGLPQLWNVFVPPLMDVTGWSQIAFHLVGESSLRLLFFIPVVLLILLLVMAVLTSKPWMGDFRLAGLLMVMTFSICAFLLGLTSVFGHFCDWTGQTRYYIPVYFGWICLAIMYAFDNRTHLPLRVAVFLLCGAPIAASFIGAVSKPVIRSHPDALPASGLAAATGERAGYEFLHKMVASNGPPSLIVAKSPHPMNELGVPTVPWFYLAGKPHIYSSRPMVIWTLLDPAISADFRHRLDSRVLVRSEAMSSGAPWELQVVNFP